MYRFLWQHEGIIFEHQMHGDSKSSAHTQHTHAANHSQVLFLQSSSAVWFDKILGRTHGWPFYPCLIRLLCEHPAACNQATVLLKRPQVCLWAPHELRGVENVTNVSVLRHTDFLQGSWTLWGRCKRAARAGTVLSPNSILAQMQQKLCSV